MTIHNNTNPSDSKNVLAEFKLRVKEAWVVMSLLPDKDARFRAGLRGSWTLPVVHDARDAYAPRDYRDYWVPTPQEITQAEIIMGWMVWLIQIEGKLSIMRIIGWAMGVPYANLGAREHCSDRTIANRVDRSLSKVLREFKVPAIEEEIIGLEFKDTRIDDIDVINDPELSNRRPRFFAAERETADSDGEVMAGKCFISGVGLMFHGKPCKTGENVLDRAEAKWRLHG